MFYSILRNLMFQFDSESVHNFSMQMFRDYPGLMSQFFKRKAITESARVMSKNLNWKNSIGLAAGFDKDGIALDFFDSLGFGAIEVGTVTRHAQVGNERPRMFRLKQELSLRNSMGFPSKGHEFVLSNVKQYSGSASLGVNIGKNKDTPLERAHEDYVFLYNEFRDFSDYLVINVSSPNTVGLRELQRTENLEIIFNEIQSIKKKTDPPLFIKISPDESMESVHAIYELALKYNLQGIIATNTTRIESLGKGGVSGELLKKKSFRIIEDLLKKSQDLSGFDIIGVGGFSTHEDVSRFRDLGGKFFQVYSSFVYQGPKVVELGL